MVERYGWDAQLAPLAAMLGLERRGGRRHDRARHLHGERAGRSPWRTPPRRAGAWPRPSSSLLFARDAAAMASIWWNSSTFNHCLLILPIIAWLVAQRRAELARLTPAAWWPGLLLAGAGALGWLLGEAGGIAFARHLGLVFMLQGAVIACLGKAVARGLAFPLFYALFLVPSARNWCRRMQTLTAEMTSGLLALTGVPAHLEGVFITTPTGYFEVAEACAGVKFLIAMVAFGALVANVCFRSWPRRIAFMAVSIARPDPRQRHPRLGNDLCRASKRQHRFRGELRPCRLWRHLLRDRHRA